MKPDIAAHCGILLLAAVLCQGLAHAQAGSPFRYDDNVLAYAAESARVNLYDDLKYIPLGGGADDYLTFGADVREREEVNSNALLGFRTRGLAAYDLHRLLLFADLHSGGWQVFVQLGNETEAGRTPEALPTDIDRGDLAQGFLSDTFAYGPGKFTVRLGRFKMAYDEGALLGLRDGPNVRQVWDGLQSFYVLPEARIDAFVVKPVNVSAGYFDDRSLAGQTPWVVHVAASPALIAPLQVTAFYYGNTMPQVRFYPRQGKEQTHTVGVRLPASGGGVDGSIGGIGLDGTLAGRDVATWAAHADAGWTLHLPWVPRLGVRSDILSGGGGATGTVHIFNALYPDYAYSTEATIEAPASLIQVGATLGVNILLRPSRSMPRWKAYGAIACGMHSMPRRPSRSCRPIARNDGSPTSTSRSWLRGMSIGFWMCRQPMCISSPVRSCAARMRNPRISA